MNESFLLITICLIDQFNFANGWLQAQHKILCETTAYVVMELLVWEQYTCLLVFWRLVDNKEIKICGCRLANNIESTRSPWIRRSWEHYIGFTTFSHHYQREGKGDLTKNREGGSIAEKERILGWKQTAFESSLTSPRARVLHFVCATIFELVGKRLRFLK